MLSIAYLAVFGSVIAFSAYYYLIKRMDATMVSLSTLIIPITALALGHVFLQETVMPRALAGIATIIAGVTVALVPATRRSADEISARSQVSPRATFQFKRR